MNEAKHTPGPWVTDSEVGDESVLDSDGRMVADCAIFGAGFTAANNRANARLISAAPELVMAAQLALAFALLKWGNLDPDANAAFDKVRAAIAKATGGAA